VLCRCCRCWEGRLAPRSPITGMAAEFTSNLIPPQSRGSRLRKVTHTPHINTSSGPCGVQQQALHPSPTTS